MGDHPWGSSEVEVLGGLRFSGHLPLGSKDSDTAQFLVAAIGEVTGVGSRPGVESLTGRQLCSMPQRDEQITRYYQQIRRVASEFLI
jgi:hypothetical protein